MASPVFTIELDQFLTGLMHSRKAMEAVRETFRLQGAGETITSRRKKEFPEKKKPQHGRFISWFFREKLNRDAFELDKPDTKRLMEKLEETTYDAVERAFAVESEQSEVLKEAMAEAADEFARIVRKRIEDGELGRQTKRTADKKRGFILAEIIGTEFGNPPPRGIRSGRWVKGIRGRWRQGRI